MFLERGFFFFAKTAHFSELEWIRSNFKLIGEVQTLVFRFCYFYPCIHSPRGSSSFLVICVALGSPEPPSCNGAMDVCIQFQHLLIIPLPPWVSFVKVRLWNILSKCLVFFSAELIITLLLFLIIFEFYTIRLLEYLPRLDSNFKTPNDIYLK